ASTTKRKSVDGGNGGFSQRLQTMNNFLAEQRKIFPVYRGALRQFVDVRAGDECFFTRASEDHDANGIVKPRCRQALAQLFDGLAIQCVQYIRAIERDSRDMKIG